MSRTPFLKAALLGLAIAFSSGVSLVQAQALRVLDDKSSSSVLNVPMNRAVVVESEDPFAELSIANPQIADISTLSDRTIYVLGKTPGRTTLTLLGPDGRLIANVEVQVAPDVAEFKERLRQILPGEEIEVRTANDGIVLSGTASSIERMDRALDLANRYAPDRVSNLMVVGGSHQVMLKVRFAEMQRNVSKQLDGGLNLSGGNGNLLAVGSGGLTGAGGQGSITNAFNLNGEAIGASIFGFDIDSLRLDFLLEALEQKGIVRTLAEPNLVALSGQEAKFLAGGEYPVPVAQDSGLITVEYKPFGIELNFVPRVVDGDKINISFETAVSSIDPTNSFTQNGFTIDAFRRREANTTVEMRDGESFAIAGLIQDTFQDLNNQVPWIGDVPVLGTLFRSTSYQRGQTELVIIITPHLVSATRGEALALPTDRIVPPTERELFLGGRVIGQAPKKGPVAEVAKQDFTGSYGYVME
ncbi:MAG: type II and III secretion system protein family protein [Pseudomonadota bacterium]